MLSNVHNTMVNQINTTLGIKLEIAALIVLVILLVLHLFLTKWLWNNVLVKLVPSIKRATSMWQMFGLTILMSFLIPK